MAVDENTQVRGTLDLLLGFNGRIMKPDDLPDEDCSSFFINNLTVGYIYRGQGIATCLMKEAHSRAKVCGGLWLYTYVFADNDIARNLYSKMGYCEVGVVETLDARASLG